MPSYPSNSELAYLNSIIVAITIVVIVEGEVTIAFERAMIFLKEGSSSSSESNTSASSEESAVQPDGGDWPAVRRS